MFQPKKPAPSATRPAAAPAKDSDEMAKAKVAALRKKKPPMPPPESEGC